MSILSSKVSLVRNLVTTHPETEPQDIRSRDDNEAGQDGSISPQERIKRVAARTMDLGRSLTTRTQSPSSLSQSNSRRILSLNRKGKGRETQTSQDQGEDFSQSSAPPLRDAPGSVHPDDSTAVAVTDDSPFITPPSPTRPSFKPFRDFGSMRAGTQTLIQALHALPWVDDPDNEDEPTSPINSPMDSDSDDEPTASSIHAIYRPVARSRRTEASHSILSDQILLPQQEDQEAVDAERDVNLTSDDDVDADDFEAATPRPAESQQYTLPTPVTPTTTAQLGPPLRRRASSRAGSMTTVKMTRRVRLAEKLKDIFELEAIKEVRAEMPCWLLRSVLLQGYMYLTNSHLCFFAHMPSREDQVLKSGTLSKKATRTKRWIKHWFVLKNDTLSWYQSSSDPYFLNGIVDLRYALSCDPVGEKEIRLRTNQKDLYLSTDSVPSRKEWVKAIRRVIFKAQNMGDTVKIAVPYSVILDVEKSSAIDFSETIEVKVFDKDEHSVDSYFFAYFHDIQGALEHIRDAVRTHRTLFPNSPQALLDTTATRPQPSASHGLDRTRSLPSPDAKNSSSFRLSSFLRPIQDSLPSTIARLYSAPESPEGAEDFTHISKRGGTSFVPVSTVPWNVGVPSWWKVPRRGWISSASNSAVDSAFPAPQSAGGVSEVYSTHQPSSSGQASGIPGDLGYSVLERPEAVVDLEMAEKFKAAFAFDAKETLLGYFSCYLFRLLPISGRLFVSSNYLCFKSTGPLSTKTRMILPIRDILTVEKTKAARFGHHGLTVVIRGHEEIFFEFGFEDRRRAFFGPRNSLSNDNPPAPSSDAMSESLPAVMFTSASSTFLTFKPKESLHFTFLTIGSRGDVQPYIALAKGLMADGHRVKIATHGEFQSELSMGYVGGDPAELINICVENGTFTVSFLKEGLLKFRGWLDDLLKTSWEACQGTDVLIESPSAMGGYHIAEALGIPYFRAFTMVWTRTRAYPHAFAVPEHKMGGGYNYMTYVMFDQVFWRAISGQINRWRRNVLHLNNTNLDRMEPHKIPFLYSFSPTVVPPPLDWPEWIRITGYWFLEAADVGAKKWTPPSELLHFIDSARQAGKKVVYIGFGSIVVPDPKGMSRCVIEAVVQSGVYAILSKGWSDRLHTQATETSQPEEPLPKQIYPIASIPHDWLFQRIDAACHHGGAGTTGASLRAGIPTIIRPFFGDQFFWADRVEALGIGTGVRKLTVDSLRDALISATTDQKQIDRARLVGQQIRSENGISTAIEAIYRDLDYARSLIRQPSNSSPEERSNSTEEEQFPDSSTSALDRSGSRSRYDSFGSRRGSEDWSVVSDPEDKRSSFGSRKE
ncbi:glycosyltransferase family 1 protein [Melanogaster broomeanus]|nr:glycosyltransferase family 1 protein [Melanogaster broomeanus]